MIPGCIPDLGAYELTFSLLRKDSEEQDSDHFTADFFEDSRSQVLLSPGASLKGYF